MQKQIQQEFEKGMRIICEANYLWDNSVWKEVGYTKMSVEYSGFAGEVEVEYAILERL